METRSCYQEADLVIRHAKIYTMAISMPDFQAGERSFPIIDDGGIAAKDGRIAAVGHAWEMGPFIGPHTRVIDATGKIVTPGFVESHEHVSFLGEKLANVDLSGMTSRKEVLSRIEQAAADAPAGEWVLANGWNELAWDDSSFITAPELDEVCPNHPFFGMRTCFHCAMANSLALREAGIDDRTPDPYGGSLERTADGHPTGILHENSALNLIQSVIPEPTQEQRIRSLERAGDYLLSLGITSSVDANLAPQQMRAYTAAKRAGRLRFRANLMFYLDSAFGDAKTHLRRLDEMCCTTGFGDDMLKLNGVKVTLDGTPSAHTALLRDSYPGMPGFHGTSTWSQEEIAAFVVAATELGWQFGIHCTGDATADLALNAFKEASRHADIASRHDYLIHFVLSHPDQWETVRRLGLGVTMQPTIACQMGEWPMFSDAIAKRYMAPGLMLKQHIICAGSSDAPVVDPNPLLGMYYAITRRDEKTGTILSEGEESKVTPLEALYLWTKAGAWFSEDEDRLGSIEQGNLADMLIFGKDLFAGSPEDLKTAHPETTILGGSVVFEA